MLRKPTMLALTAIAALGLTVSNANAMPGKPGFFGPAKANPGMFKPISKPNIPIKPIFVPHWPHHHPHWEVHYRPRIWYPPVAVGGPTYIASRPVVSTPGR